MARAPRPAAASNSIFLVTSDWAFSGAVIEPAGEELQLDVADAVVGEDFLHVGQRVAAQGVLQVRMPDAHAGEARLAGLLGADAEIDGAVLRSGVRHGTDGQSPVGGEQIDLGIHSAVGCTPLGAAAVKGRGAVDLRRATPKENAAVNAAIDIAKQPEPSATDRPLPAASARGC